MTWLQDEMAYDGITMRLATGLPGHQTTKTTTPRRFKILCWQVWCFANASCSIPRGILFKYVQMITLLFWTSCRNWEYPGNPFSVCPYFMFFSYRIEQKENHLVGHMLLSIVMSELRFWSCSYPQHIIAQLDRVHGYFALQFSIFMKSRQIFTK